MNHRTTFTAALIAAGLTSTFAGPAPVEPHKRTWFPDDPVGNITLGMQFSEKLTGITFDAITGIWASQKGDKFLFLNGRYHYEDNSQFISSTGLGFRRLVPGHDIILGANIYYDSINSEHGDDFGVFR